MEASDLAFTRNTVETRTAATGSKEKNARMQCSAAQEAQWEPKFGDSANWVAALCNLVDNVLSFGRLAKPVSHPTPCLLIVP